MRAYITCMLIFVRSLYTCVLGATIAMNYGGQRELNAVGVTVQHSALLKLQTWFGEISDIWTLNVRHFFDLNIFY